MSFPEASLWHLTNQWLEWDKDPETRREIEELRDAHNDAELEKRLRNRIQFGTAGLRGKMAAGFAYMNCLTVIQTSQGLAKYLRKKFPERSSFGVVIGADARKNSGKFAALAANAFLAEGIKVWWYDNVCTTPLVSYGTRMVGAVAGVMITASHNPAEDNGYKVFLYKGVQVNSPIDAEISQSIKENLHPWPGAWDDLEVHVGNPLMYWRAYQDFASPWIGAIRRYALSTVDELKTPTPFMYTPLHGTGGIPLPHLLHEMKIGKQMLNVDAQFDPDPTFRTVPYPNPEEDGTLDIAMFCAENNDRPLVIANDPDADRFAVAQKVERGSWYTFTGNQIGVLLASHIFESLEYPCKKKGYVVLSSAVSSIMLEKMAKAHGIRYQETLTGFKWMGNIARKLEEDGYEVPFAYEEALGYMFPKICYDKDGITAAAVFLVAEGKWRSQGLTPFDKLEHLFERYGHHETFNNYFRSPDPATTAKLFEKIRNGPWRKGEKFGSFKILRWRDVTKGYDSDTPDNKPELPVDPGSQMLTLWLDRDVKFTLRASGTEPKVKFYIESWINDKDEAIKAVCDTFTTILKQWIRPFAPTMTHKKEFLTSSSHLHVVRD
ncbi:hypothetical protein VTN77DRAFT_9818 [Rasamsonia byssochlamydoides]|uniref:uncharacterized protein n=1 Tax=Rasamsonia byssochlamydoides TaxID=89139 RepID=UPI003742AF3C